ncbi:cupin domain-containing protein [Rhodococcus opacus]|nr:cupin domain-containing protein [Rhodococcus opacus]
MEQVERFGPHMQAVNIEDGNYPDMSALSVRTDTGSRVHEHHSPQDVGIVHDAQDFPVRWLRERAPGFEGTPLAAGVLLMKPCVLDFTFVGDETILLISGAIDVVDDQYNIARLRAGDMAYFAAGTATTWTVLEESVELFTILG